METTWNREKEFRNLTFDTICDYLSASPFRPVSATLLAEGKANTNFKVDLADGSSVVLRLHMRDPLAAELERSVTELVASEVPVARVRFQSADPVFSVLEWKPGRSMERLIALGELSEVRSASRDLGAALAKMSKHEFPQSGMLAPNMHVCEPWSSTVDGLMGYTEWLTEQERVVQRTGEDLARSVRDLCRSTRRRFEETVGPPCLVHGDFKASNLLIDQGQLSAVLDWEFAHAGTYLMSIGQLFRHRSKLPEGFENGFVDGFESNAAPLPGDWRHLSRVVDLLSMMDFLNRDATGPQMAADVISIVSETLNSPN